MNEWVVALHRATPASQVVWFTTNPAGGGFGSNRRGGWASVERVATKNIPTGATYRLEKWVGNLLLSVKEVVKA